MADPAQADTDGDRVGNACDPLPATPSERIVFFDPFTASDPGWAIDRQVSYDGDSFSVDVRGNGTIYARHVLGAGSDVYEIAGHVGAQDCTPTCQVFIAAEQTPQTFDYCELLDRPATSGSKFGLVYTYDNFLFNTIDSANPVGRIADGDFMLRLVATPGTPTCTTSWPADRATLSGAGPTDIIGSTVALWAQGLEVRFDYFIAIRTEP